MPQQAIDFLEDNYHVDRELGAINAIEAWWVERQEALERAGGHQKLHFAVKMAKLKWYVSILVLTSPSIHEFSCVWAWMQFGSPTEDL